MNARTNRWLVWTGPLFSIVFVVAVLALEGNTPGEKASAKEVVSYFESHQGRTLTEAFLAPLMCALLIAFACHVRDLARARSRAPGAWPMVMVGGSVVWGLGLLLGATLSLAVSTASHHGQDQAAVTVNVLSNDAWLPFIAGIAITMLGAGVTVLQSGLLPRWLGWVAVVVGIASLIGPGGFLGFFVAPLWLLVAGIMLSRAPSVIDLADPQRSDEPAPATTTATVVEP
jgi:hypothetical protein